MRKTLYFLIMTFSLAGTTACSFPGVYKINVQQGTIVEQKDLDQLKPGMSPKQVHFVLGSPSLINTFDSSQEGYLYTFQKAGGKIQKQKVVVFYDEAGKYARYEAQLLAETPAY